MKNTLTIIAAILFTQLSYAQTVSCEISDIQSTKGDIIIGIFKDSESFELLKPFKKIKLSKSKIKNGVLNIKVNLSPGEYGFTILDDVNKSGEMDYGFFGIPDEGFGFSNYYHTGLSSPDFSDFKFKITENQLVKTKIKVKYM